MVGPGEACLLQLDRSRMEKALTGDRNFSISCELGVRYPSLRSIMMMNRDDLHLRTSVRFHFNGYAYHILCICFVYTINIHEYNDHILSKFI
jgi:hypothetical protein